MAEKLLWSSRMTQDYIKGLSDEEKKNMLLDRGYDAEMLDGVNLDDVIENDDYMWQDDADDFNNTILPMINSQTNAGIVLAVNKDDPQSNVIAIAADNLIGGDIASDSNAARIVDNDGVEVEYYFNDTPVMTLELYAIPEEETAQQDFVQNVMPEFADQFATDSGNTPSPIDIKEALSDTSTLETWVNKDNLRKSGKKIVSTLGESLEECGTLNFPKEPINEARNSGVGYENANRFIEYLADNDGLQIGAFGEETAKNNGGSVRLYSQVADVTFTFTDDEGVVVEGEVEDEDGMTQIEEYFDSVNDFAKWYKNSDLSFTSDYGDNIEKFLWTGKDEFTESEENPEKIVQETRASNPEALAEEVEEIEMDLEDFGPEGFYAVPFDRFKREFPEFTKDVINTFLIKYVELKPEELEDPEVIAAWQDGDLITKRDWSTLIEGAKALAAGESVWWSGIYKKHYTETESLTEDTVKQNGKWVNKGKEGTHGKFKTKKAADAQRKAMYANGYKGESLEETDKKFNKSEKPLTEDINDNIKQVENILAENGDYYHVYEKDGMIAVEVEWGDWKHDHLYLDNLLSRYGLVKVDEEETEEDGSDTYSSIHYFEDPDLLEEETVKESLTEGNVEKLKKHYGPMFDEQVTEELAHNQNADIIRPEIHDVVNKLDNLSELADDSGAPETAKAASDAKQVLRDKEDVLTEDKDYFVVPGDLDVLK